MPLAGYFSQEETARQGLPDRVIACLIPQNRLIQKTGGLHGRGFSKAADLGLVLF